MFLKPFHIKTQTSIKGSDRKKLRSEIGKLYPRLTTENQNEIIPSKEPMTVTKLCTHSGDTVVVYSVGNNPVFFEADRTLFPTVYILWKYTDMLPVFTTWPPVIGKLAGGADLMLPGVVVKSEITPTTFGQIDKGAVCSVNVVGNRSPVVVGTTLLSGSDMFYAGMKGKGIHPVHMFGDELWKLGDKSSPPSIPDDTDSEEDILDSDQLSNSETVASDHPSNAHREVSPNLEKLTINSDVISEEDTGESGCGAVGNVETCRNANGINIGECSEERHNEESNCVVEDPDSLLEFCFKCALKSSLKKTDLPVLTSNFFRNFILPFACGRNIDVKKTRYKKLSKFMSVMQEKEYIRVQELTKGVDSIVEFDRSHIGLRDIQVPDLSNVNTENSEVEPVTEYQPAVITEMVSITKEVLPLVKDQGYVKGSALTTSDFRKSITQYVKNNSLQSETTKGQVQLDPFLAAIALHRDEGDVPTLKWDDLFSRLLSKTQAVHQIAFQGKEAVIIKGKVRPITLEVKQRASNKKVTLVENLETFGIDPKQFAHKVQIGLSCSTSVSPLAEKNRGVQVTIQGNQIRYVGNLLLDVYKVSRKYIQGLEKAPKGNKR